MKQFHKIKVKKPKKSAFNLSHEHKYSIDMGDLVPNFLQEIIPGDSFNVQTEALVRFQPLLAPIMHRVNVYQHYFFVPYRLIWSEWEDFITGGEQGDLEPVFPTFSGKPELDRSTYDKIFAEGKLSDYMGLPTTQLRALLDDRTCPAVTPCPAIVPCGDVASVDDVCNTSAI